MNVLLRDPCCLAGLGILAVGGMIALVSLVTIKVRDAWRRIHARLKKEVRDA